MTTKTTTTTAAILTENDDQPVVAQTLAYDLQATEKEEEPVAAEIVETTKTTTMTTTTMIEFDEPPAQTLAYDLQSTNEQINLNETEPAVCADTQAYDLNEQIAETSPRPASETMEVVPVSKLVEQLEDIENAPEDTTNTKQQVNVIIDEETVKEVANEVQMETDSATVDTNQQETLMVKYFLE